MRRVQETEHRELVRSTEPLVKFIWKTHTINPLSPLSYTLFFFPVYSGGKRERNLISASFWSAAFRSSSEMALMKDLIRVPSLRSGSHCHCVYGQKCIVYMHGRMRREGGRRQQGGRQCNLLCTGSGVNDRSNYYHRVPSDTVIILLPFPLRWHPGDIIIFLQEVPPLQLLFCCSIRGEMKKENSTTRKETSQISKSVLYTVASSLVDARDQFFYLNECEVLC